MALSVRLARADWERLHQLAVAEGVSLQEIIVRGLSRCSHPRACPASAHEYWRHDIIASLRHYVKIFNQLL